jgi:hypothetical protein
MCGKERTCGLQEVLLWRRYSGGWRGLARWLPKVHDPC